MSYHKITNQTIDQATLIYQTIEVHEMQMFVYMQKGPGFTSDMLSYMTTRKAHHLSQITYCQRQYPKQIHKSHAKLQKFYLSEKVMCECVYLLQKTRERERERE